MQRNNVLSVGEESFVEATVTYNDGIVFENVIVTVEVYRTGSLVESSILTETSPGNYSGSVKIGYSGVLNVKVVAYKAGYGYSSSDLYPVLAEKVDHERSPPNFLIVVIALANIGVVVLFGMKFALHRKK